MSPNKLERLPMIAQDIMSKPLITVTTTTPVAEIAQTIIEKQVSAVPVVDAAGILVGLVSASDLLEREDLDTAPTWNWLRQKVWPRAAAKQYTKAHGSRAEHVMSTDLVTVSQTADLPEVIATMVQRGIQRVIVVDGGEPVGILSRRDVLRAILQQQAPHSQAIKDEAIQRDLSSKLQKQPWFSKSSIQISVKNGMVTLQGVVFSRDERSALLLAAESCPGVTEVRDQTVSEFQ
jgi:CBS domain-containing protein